MIKPSLALVCLALVFNFVCFFSVAQSYEYRSTENPFYWKNRPPHPGYWQQDVHYQMDVELIPEENLIKSNSFKLTYWNNSPHQLNELFFHLYQQAFQPGSYYDRLWMDNGRKAKYGSNEIEGKCTHIWNVRVNGVKTSIQPDNSIVKVILPSPIPAGDSAIIEMDFKSWFDKGDMRRRMKVIEEMGQKSFGAVFWYPSICVYDAKRGWNVDQHLDKEFYNNFGSFDLSLTLPSHFIVEASGLPTNKALTDEELELLKIKQTGTYRDTSQLKPKLPTTGAKRTWQWRAVNVHNMAFAASPLFTRADTIVNGVQIVALPRTVARFSWKETLGFMADIIKNGNNYFGEYAWPKIVIADMNDGMEYPMIAFVGGAYPANRGLLTHEIGHMWYYGMIGSNETYRAAMDEGFTQFFTSWVMDELQQPKRGFFIHKDFGYPVNYKYTDSYYGYLSMRKGGQDAPLNTHSSDFNTSIGQDGGYGQVYFKTSTMLYNLKYVLGDRMFFKAMKNYFNQWKFCHPYPEDFRRSMTDYTRTDLSWFFDQWMETTKSIDYGIDRVGRNPENGKLQILFRRHGDMQMPLEFVVANSSYAPLRFYIPNTWFLKDSVGTILPKWYGWSGFNRYYLAEIEVPFIDGIVVIDPTFSIADTDMSDNTKTFGANLNKLVLPEVINAKEEKKRYKHKLKK
jgi:hypothetical protein